MKTCFALEFASIGQVNRIKTAKVLRLAVLIGVAISSACDKVTAPAMPKITTLAIVNATAPICPSDTVRLAATARDSGGKSVSNSGLRWSSNQPGIATVDSNGFVRAVSGGVAIIRVTSGDVFAEASVSVRAPVVRFSYKYPSLFVGDTTAVKAVVADLNGVVAQEPTTSVSSGNTAVATISTDGVISGRSAGTANIVAMGACGAKGEVQVAVLEPRVRANRELVYLFGTYPDQGLKTVFEDGSGVRVVSAPGENVEDFLWSPDGSRLLIFYSSNTGRYGTYITNADGSNEMPLAVPAGVSVIAPDWSPDGARIAYRNYISYGESDVYTVRTDGSDIRRLTTALGDDLNPKWSPDGRQILYVRRPTPTSQELWIVAVNDTSENRKVKLQVASANNPRWSPDGKYIAFDNGSGVFIVNADGSMPRALTPYCTPEQMCTDSPSYQSPAWNPKGTSLAFTSDFGVAFENIDGTGFNVFHAAPVSYCCKPGPPTWSPDGRSVVFNSEVGVTPYRYGIAIVGPTGIRWLVTIPPLPNVGRAFWRP